MIPVTNWSFCRRLTTLAATVIAVAGLAACSQGTLIEESPPDGGETSGTDTTVPPNQDSGQTIPDTTAPKSGIDKCVALGESGGAEECHGLTVDGSKSIYVAPTGKDSNPGTQASPKRTIQAGIDAADSKPDKVSVLAQAGTYEETVELASGIDLVGGYDSNWKRGGKRTLIRGDNPALQAGGIEDTTRLADIVVQVSASAAGRGDVTTVYLRNSPGVALHAVEIFGAEAGDGAAGADGKDGEAGKKGGRGGDGPIDDGNVFCKDGSAPQKGAGGDSPCEESPGGAGGRGGHGGTGEQGKNGGGGALSGRGGQAGASGQDGQPGKNGMPGQAGEAGEGGTPDGTFAGLNDWQGGAGGKGQPGEAGGGGGGGGGAGGQDEEANPQPRCVDTDTIADLCSGCSLIGVACSSACVIAGYATCSKVCDGCCCKIGCEGHGGSGGGGGAGGCGGKAGEGGKPGGASVALFLENSDIEIYDSLIAGGKGGNGGAGGQGGRGAPGGQGGPPGSGEGLAGNGGPGGAGGRGGAGGPGGGGAGGPAFSIYSTKALSNQPDNTVLQKGQGGEGGASPSGDPAGKGAKGKALKIKVATQ